MSLGISFLWRGRGTSQFLQRTVPFCLQQVTMPFNTCSLTHEPISPFELQTIKFPWNEFSAMWLKFISMLNTNNINDSLASPWFFQALSHTAVFGDSLRTDSHLLCNSRMDMVCVRGAKLLWSLGILMKHDCNTGITSSMLSKYEGF